MQFQQIKPSSQQQLKRNIPHCINPIQKRANSKIVNINNRYFLIGGITTKHNTNDIYQFRIILSSQQQYELEWKKLQFQNNIFTSRNSFSICYNNNNNKIYIWGGMQLNQHNMIQKCLDDLIEIDIGMMFYLLYRYKDNGKMRKLQLKESIKIHSSSLFFDKQSNCLIGFGGTNQNSSMEAYLYQLSLDLKQGEDKYQWKKRLIKNSTKQGVLWQHTGNFYKRSLFQSSNTNEQGKYLLLVGGCRYPWSPYKTVTQIDLKANKITGSIDLQQALVAHQSVYDQKNHCVYIVGGANGGGFNRWIYKISGPLDKNGSNQGNKQSSKPRIYKIQGHNAVGGACVLTKQNWLLVYGGVCGPQMLNDMIVYYK